MELNSSFAVDAPVEKVWATLMDIERVAGALPGAQVLGKLSEDAYQLGVKVKLGPVTMQYRGQLNVIERDEIAHRAVLSGQAKETRGQGTAQATATMTLTENGGTTTGAIHTDLALSGKAAVMGKSVIGTVSEQLMTQFAANLQEMLDEPASPEPALSEQQPNQSSAGELLPEPSTPERVSAPPTTPGSAEPVASREDPHSPADNSLDALALSKAVVAGQLSDPRKVGVLLVVVAAIGFALGRRGHGDRGRG